LFGTVAQIADPGAESHPYPRALPPSPGAPDLYRGTNSRAGVESRLLQLTTPFQGALHLDNGTISKTLSSVGVSSASSCSSLLPGDPDLDSKQVSSAKPVLLRFTNFASMKAFLKKMKTNQAGDQF
jgi:hypothetical protein